MVAARYGGFALRDSAAIGALMNTRGLTELIVLNIGLDLGLISPTLFTMLVVMALVTTFMAGPALRLIDPQQRALARRPRRSCAEAHAPRRAVPSPALDPRRRRRTRGTSTRCSRIAEPLATARAAAGAHHRAARRPGGASRPASLADERELRRATRGGATRDATCFVSAASTPAPSRSRHPTPARTSSASRSDEDVDLLLVDGRRPLLGDGVPAGEVGACSSDAPCDVAVLVERRRAADDRRRAPGRRPVRRRRPRLGRARARRRGSPRPAARR